MPVRGVESGGPADVDGESPGGRVAQHTGETPAVLRAQLQALRERVAELEAAAAEREQRMEAVYLQAFESRAALMALSTFGEGRFIEVNDAFVETLGFSREEVIGKTSEELELFVQTGQRDALTKAAARRGYARNVPITVRTKAGALRYGLFSADIISLEGEECWFTVMVDITAHKEAEAALRESEETWRSILKNAPGSIAAAAPKGTITFVNWTHTGIPPERVIGTNVFDHVPREQLQTLKDAFRGALENGETVTYEVVVDPTGAPIPIECRVGPLERNGEIVGVTIVSLDISERKRAEEQQRKLEASMQNAQRLESLGVLAGGIAHDFNNLLEAILGGADLALMEIAPKARHRQWVEKIKLTARRASDLTKQMLAYAGQGTYVAERLDLSALVAEMESLLEVSISKKVVLNHQLDSEVALVNADAGQMRQVVMNLIMNASEAIGDEGGSVTIRVSEVDVDERSAPRMYIGGDLPAGRYVSLEVTDTGCGMDAESVSKLFDPFFTTKFAGRGLGLASVLGIVRAHRGDIEVRSQPDEGSTFRILLPAAEGSVAAPSEDPGLQRETWRGSGTLLVADDEESVRAVIREMLERKGFKVITAADGREAVRIFRSVSKDVDAVLLDLTMPHMDGDQALREMRRLRSDVKAILLSGYAEEQARERCDGQERVALLQKPFDLEALVSTLRAVLAPDTKGED
jgi:PAS domain S-box-containing protein